MSDISLKKKDAASDEGEEQGSEQEAPGDNSSDNKSEENDSDTEKNEGEEVEKDEEPESEHQDEDADTKELPKKEKKKLRERIKAFFANPKKRLIFIIVSGLVLIGVFGLGLYLLTHDSKAVTKNEETKKTAEVKAVLYPAVLDGVMTDQESASRHPLGIIVENHPDARPQSGVNSASIVYEAIAEGGITRYLAIYSTNEAEKVGPVRSVRTYYVDWAHGYDAYLAHVGGNYDALQKIPKDKIYDLDQFRYSSPYHREYSAGLASEHTMYTSTTKLRSQAATNKYDTANNFTILKFKDDPTTDAEKALLPASQEAAIDFSTAQFKVKFVYDKTTNSYKRFLAGKADVDSMTKEQITAKNIIVMTVKRQPTVTAINEQGYNMTTIGEGKAKIFLDGKTIDGTWKKTSAEDRELFYDETGKEIVFNRGKFWISVIPPEGSVTAQ